jgi:hypothetical protein
MIENILWLKRESTNFENVVDEAFIAEWGGLSSRKAIWSAIEMVRHVYGMIWSMEHDMTHINMVEIIHIFSTLFNTKSNTEWCTKKIKGMSLFS